MNLELQRSLESDLFSFYNKPAQVVELVNHGGSFFNQTGLLKTNIGHFFLKLTTAETENCFQSEQLDLTLLKQFAKFKIPDCIALGSAGGYDYLLLEFLEVQPEQDFHAVEAGQLLAQLHQHPEKQFGLNRDNKIGPLKQLNNWHDDYIEFFVNCRITPLLQQAFDKGLVTKNTIQSLDKIFTQLDGLFSNAQPSLLHGDLWGGNIMFLQKEVAIYDPAVYYGHPEQELAFTYFFGGFSATFYASYNNVNPIQPDLKQRAWAYNLYPLLVHALIYEGNYVEQLIRTASKF